MSVCKTCRHNWEECHLFTMQGCGEKYDFAKWEPYTNADRIRKMTDEELADWMMQAGVDGRTKLICKDYAVGCWFTCTQKHRCEKYGNISARYEILDWLKGEADDYPMQ